MYTPPAFKEDDPQALHAMMREAGLATLVTATAEGIMATPLPLLLDTTEGQHGTLYGHLSKANRQTRVFPSGDGLALFQGLNAYVSPSWYATKLETGKVVPTWNYVAVHAHGPVEFFDDRDRLRDVVARLTAHHEQRFAQPWDIADAPASYIDSQLKGIVGMKMTIMRLAGKRKMSQDESARDRQGVQQGLAESRNAIDRAVAPLISTAPRST